MARRSLRPHLNQIRSWVRQGRTDAWVAHQLEVTVQEIEQFKRQNDLLSDETSAEGAGGVATFPEEIDLRAEDDELIAAELEAAAEQAKAQAEAEVDGGGGGGGGGEESATRRRRRSRRVRRPGARASDPLEGTFDHGEEGYGLWLDPAIQENPIYAEHWAGHRPVQVIVEADQIVIRRTAEDES